MGYKSFKDLDVWNKSLVFVVAIYGLVSNLPRGEAYGLVSQMQRASVSIPSNIAEGSQKSRADFRRHCLIAQGSAAELETQLYLVRKLYSISCDKYIGDLEDVQKMLTKLIRSLATTNN